MPTIQVDGLLFEIQTNFDAQKYDEWDHDQRVLKPLGSYSAVDLVIARSQQAPRAVWLVEAKDYRVISNPPERSNLQGLAETVAKKVYDTLRGLEAAAVAAEQESERSSAARALSAQSRRVVLHLEPHTGQHSKLFPTNFPNGVYQKLKQLIRGIDPNPLVLSIANTGQAGVPWGVS